MKGVKHQLNIQPRYRNEHYKGKPIERWRRKTKGAKALCHASQLHCIILASLDEKGEYFYFAVNFALN